MAGVADGDEDAGASEKRLLGDVPALQLKEPEEEVAELDGLAEPLQAGDLVVL